LSSIAEYFIEHFMAYQAVSGSPVFGWNHGRILCPERPGKTVLKT
jgi:hypothetical protein